MVSGKRKNKQGSQHLNIAVGFALLFAVRSATAAEDYPIIHSRTAASTALVHICGTLIPAGNIHHSHLITRARKLSIESSNVSRCADAYGIPHHLQHTRTLGSYIHAIARDTHNADTPNITTQHPPLVTKAVTLFDWCVVRVFHTQIHKLYSSMNAEHRDCVSCSRFRAGKSNQLSGDYRAIFGVREWWARALTQIHTKQHSNNTRAHTTQR